MKDKKQKDETDIKELLRYANSIIATLREPFLVLNKNLQVISANRSFYATFKVNEKDTLGQRLPDLGNRQWDIPKLLVLLRKILPEKNVIENYEIEHEFKDIGHRCMNLNACQLRVPKKIAATISVLAREEELILLAIEDITDRKHLQEELKNSEERYRRAFETSKNILLLIHKTEGGILNSNASARELLGYSQEEFLKKKLWEIGIIKDDKDFKGAVSILERDGVIHYEDTPVKTKKNLSISAEVFLVDKAKVIQCNILDISERKKLDKLLKESEERYIAFIQTLPQVVYEVDAGGRFIFVSNGVKQLGYTPEELIGKHFKEIVHPDDFEVVSRFIVLPKYRGRITGAENSPKLFDERRTGGRMTQHLQIRLLRKTQNEAQSDYCYCEIDSTGGWDRPVEDKDKNLLGSVGIIQDITERKKAEEKFKGILRMERDIALLEQSLLAPAALNDKLKTITSGIMSIFDADFCRIWLIRPGDLCGQGCIHAEVKEGPHICRFRDKCLHLVASSGRYTHIDGKGHARVPFGCYKIGLIASGEEHKFLTNDVVNDPRVHNHEWARELGLVSFAGYQLRIPTGETIGVLALFAKHPILPNEDAMLDSLSTTTAFVVKQGETNQGLETQAQELQANLKEADKYREILMNMLDDNNRIREKLEQNINELKRSQNMLIQSEKLASLGRLASDIAHEVNNPLMIISGNAQLCLLSETASVEVKSAMKTIMEECQRAKGIISAVLKFAKPSKGEITEVDINKSIDEVAGLIEKQFESANVKIERNYSKNPIILPVDKQHIHELFINLLVNAREAMRDGGVITITTSLEGDYLRIDFKDTGCGMSEEAKKRLFEPFFTTKEDGTGLGLAVCYGIIKAHNGELKFESELNKGTTVTILLPLGGGKA